MQNSSKTFQKLKSLYADYVIPCQKCDIASLRGNCEKNIWGGSEDTVDLFWIGQNPAYWDVTKKQDWVNGKFSRTFPPKDNSSKKVDDFTSFLWDNGIYQRSFFTNAVKCATLQNREPTPWEADTCSIFLIMEIQIVNPKKIITLGKFAQFTVTKILNRLNYTIPIESLYHPSYIYNRNRHLIADYQQKVLAIAKP